MGVNRLNSAPGWSRVKSGEKNNPFHDYSDNYHGGKRHLAPARVAGTCSTTWVFMLEPWRELHAARLLSARGSRCRDKNRTDEDKQARYSELAVAGELAIVCVWRRCRGRQRGGEAYGVGEDRAGSGLLRSEVVGPGRLGTGDQEAGI